MTLHTSARTPASRYGGAVLLSLFAVAIRGALQPALGDILKLQLLTFAVLFSAWWGGLGAGLLATVLCAVAALAFFIPPYDIFAFPTKADELRLLIFICTGVAMSAIAEALHRAVRREQAQKEALRASEERLRLAVAATEDAVWDWDIVDQTVGWSPAVADRFGWPEAPPGSDTGWWRERIHPDDRARVVESIRAAIADPTCDHWDAEYRFQRGDGSMADVLDRGSLLRDATGKAVRMIGAMLDLTTRKQADADVRRSRAELQTIIDTVPSLISYVDRDLIYRWNSRGYERWFNRPLAEITGRSMRDLMGEEAFARVLPHIERVLAGNAQEFETYLPYEGVEGRWIHAIYAPHRTPDGKVDGIVVSVTDITESKQAELARAALAAIVENSDDAIIGKSLDGTVTSWNRAATRLFGYTAAEMIGEKITRIFPEDRLVEEEQILAAVRRGESIEHFESERRTKDGRLIDVAVTISPIHDGAGKVSGASKIARDITDRKRAEAAVRDAAEQRRLALEAADLGAWDYRFRNGEVLGDERFFRMLGVIADRLDYDTAIERIHPDERTVTHEAIQAALTGANDGKFRKEIRVIWPDGSLRWIAAHGRVYFTGTEGAREPLHFTGVCIDITERKRATEELRLASERLAVALEAAEAANRAKDAFLATLSHELRTPLTPVLFLAATLARSPDVAPSLREDFAMIRRNIELEARLIDDLLDVTRIARGKLQLDLQPVDFHTILERSIELLRRDLEDRRLALQLDLAAARHEATADPVRVQQVFWNVLKNAVKFTPAGGTITVRSHCLEPNQWHLAISDTGLGITAEEMPGIFDAFAQGEEASSHRFGGLGLGLAISERVIREHGGRIWAESAGRNEGSTFHVELALDTPPARSGSVADAASPAPARRSYHLLIVEDHEPTRLTLDRLLKRRGHQTTLAATAEHARQLAAASTFDLMVSDLGLPDGTGHELAVEFGRDYGLKAIALSGYGMEEDMQRSKAAGFLAHLTKPVDIEALYDAILRVLPHG